MLLSSFDQFHIKKAATETLGFSLFKAPPLPALLWLVNHFQRV